MVWTFTHSGSRNGEIREVFLSATVKDTRHYRTEVKEAVRHIEIAVFLQEEWNIGASPTVDLCLNRLCESDGYMGLFGFRYGWVPSTHVQSITELECQRAFKHWSESVVPDPPIFIFLPNSGSDAAKSMQRRIDSKKRQKVFCDQLSHRERFIRGFATLPELRERAIACVSNWNRNHLRNAKRGRRQALSDIPPDERGAIDREDQRKALKRALKALAGNIHRARFVYPYITLQPFRKGDPRWQTLRDADR